MSRPKHLPTLLQLVLIAPSVYVRVFDLDHQAEQFEVFHQRPLTRVAHYAGTVGILFAFFVLAASTPWPAAAVALLGVSLAAWYVAMNRVVGLVAGVVVALVALAAAQNLSHSVEPVPPTLTGRGFEPFAVYWGRASGGERLRLLALNTVYLPLELVSAPRLFAVHVLRALQRLGWRRDWAADVVVRAERILRGA